MLEFTVEDWSAEDIARLRGIYEPLAESVRGLVDATIRSEADAETGELNARMQGLDEQATRIAYANKRKGFTDAQSRNLKYGYLRGQVAGWAAE